MAVEPKKGKRTVKVTEMGLWEASGNARRKKIERGFNRKQEDRKLSKHYAT